MTEYNVKYKGSFETSYDSLPLVEPWSSSRSGVHATNQQSHTVCKKALEASLHETKGAYPAILKIPHASSPMILKPADNLETTELTW